MDFITNYYFDFDVMGDEFSRVLDGFWLTVKLSIISGVLSLAWGLVLAVLRQLPGRALAPVRWLTIAYIDVFRGIPLLLVLLLLSGFLSAAQNEGVIPRELGLPTWFGETSPFWWGVMGLTITYGAYMAEVYRAGIEAVPGGQMEAARSLGMSHGQSMRLRDRPAGRAQGDPAASERLHRPDEGHVPGRDPRRARGGPGRIRRPDRADQRLRADARRADVPRDHDPAGAAGRLADRPASRRAPSAAGARRRRAGEPSRSHCRPPATGMAGA